MKTSKVRRSELCLTFAKKSFKRDKFSNWFTVNISDFDKTKSERDELKFVKTRTQKYKKSPIPYLTEILNDHMKTQAKNKT